MRDILGVLPYGWRKPLDRDQYENGRQGSFSAWSEGKTCCMRWRVPKADQNFACPIVQPPPPAAQIPPCGPHTTLSFVSLANPVSGAGRNIPSSFRAAIPVDCHTWPNSALVPGSEPEAVAQPPGRFLFPGWHSAQQLCSWCRPSRSPETWSTELVGLAVLLQSGNCWATALFGRTANLTGPGFAQLMPGPPT